MKFSKPLRVMFVGFTYVFSSYQSKLKTIQETEKVEVAWLAPKKWNMRSWNRTITLEIKHKGFRVYPVNIRFLNGVNGGYLFPTLPLLHAIRDFQPDILHYEQEVFSLSAFQIAFWSHILKIPLVVFCWENIEKSLPFYRRITTKYVLHTANAIIAGNRDSEQIVKKWGYNGATIVAPQIGVNMNLFYPRSKKNNTAALKIGYIGRLVFEKGIDILFDAVKHLKENGIQVQIFICGSGNYESALQSYAEEIGIAKCVSWLGVIEDIKIPLLIAQTDVVVLPSRTIPKKWKEQFGHILIEAMAMGVPVIGSDSGAIPEVIGRDDLIFPEDDSYKLALLLERIFVDVRWKKEVSKSLRDRVLQKYSDEKIASLLLSVWVEVVRNVKQNCLENLHRR